MKYNLDLKKPEDFNNLAIQLLVNNSMNLEQAQKELFTIIPTHRADCLAVNYFMTENYIRLKDDYNEIVEKVRRQ